ncbi:hypothetical protein A7985_10510 [Pseudoalteromonas luteoviolacea]|uniref:HTH lysR-type domain-containing protein n=1 Tax=Pseudoalteromonas luteoviolacea TaxID=43657 RepID=A0A1C0TSH2_9GAMM|nr:LysR family transcriptional regulator [Pseudoalteromonas luteoviolacea]OCQ22208.1 hypothetical protein A7985_10510 [Pseudoalteromonas luteoviolacea]
MEFYHLKSFVAVAKAQNLTKAAKELHTTPPAVSAHIKALEQELNVTLFERTSKGMLLTPQGIALREKAQNTLNSAHDFIQSASLTDTALTGHLKIGLNLSPRVLKCQDLLMQMQSEFPNISLELSPSNSSQILSDIEAGKLDGGYTFDQSGSEFLAKFIANRNITTVMPKVWINSQQSEFELLENGTWIGMGTSCPFDNELVSRLPKAKISHYSSYDELTRIELVSQGFGASFVDESDLVGLPESVHQTSIIDFDLPLFFVVSARREKEPLIQALLNQVALQTE